VARAEVGAVATDREIPRTCRRSRAVSDYPFVVRTIKDGFAMLVGAVGRRITASAIGSTLFVACAFVGTLAPSSRAEAAFACASSSPAYTVRSGDNWYVIADRAEVSVGSLLDANGADMGDVIVPGDRLCLPRGADSPTSCSTTYSVRSGDSWYAIADRAGVSASSLLRTNEAELDSLLVPGQTICLPNGARMPAAGAAARNTDTATATTPATPQAATSPSYTVRAGDGWLAIADRFQVRAGALLAANDAELTDIIVPGQQLRLPAGAVLPQAPKKPAPKPAPAKSPATYTVRSGDGWFVIAERVQVRAGALLAANDAELTDIIVPGQQLRLPAGAVLPPEPDADAPVWVELDALPTQGPCWFSDTWNDARDGDRVHVGVDIFTIPGEYVYAVADGVLTGRAWDQQTRRSGNAWYLTSDAGHRFFYAHLKDFAPGLEVGSQVRAGQIIGWVGATGNTTYPHLHFEIQPWGGDPVNPYPMVRTQGACNRGTPYTQPGGWVPD
jgi:LysM repeat protein